MPSLLHLDSSADTTASRSRALTAIFADSWRGLGPAHSVVYRDLHREPLPHLGDASLHFAPALRPADARPEAAQEALQRTLIDELLAADAVLIGVPLYNYSMPSPLKAWLDFIHVPGVTAPFGPHATQPMAGKAVVLVSTRGGAYDEGTPSQGDDHSLPPLRIVLGAALGMTVETIVASRTLSERFGGPADQIAAQHAELHAAEIAAAELAVMIGGRLGR